MTDYSRPDAYVYRADLYCPDCISAQLPTGPGQPFDGWECLSPISAEDDLDEIAHAFGVDRSNEYTFDSDCFPKVAFRSQLAPDDYCGACHRPL